MTPMMEQYFQIKNQYKDFLLFYRVGDFYEMFYDDAKVASAAIDLTLTGKDCGEPERAPMCGVPFHAADTYIAKLIAKGFKVAICEQVEDPATAKGLVRRDVIRVVTPGTLLESSMLSEGDNNYLCAIYVGEFECGVSFADVSTGAISATTLDGADMIKKLTNELGTYSPSEIIVNIPLFAEPELEQFISARMETSVSDNHPDWFEYKNSRELIETQFADSIREDVTAQNAVVCSVGGLLTYVNNTQKGDISYIKELRIYSEGQYLEMDTNTRRNLEITETMRSKEKKGSLLWVLDKTRTAAGARMLRQWVEHPLLRVSSIVERQSAVRELYDNFILREELSELLSSVLDLERLISRIVYGSATAKDLRAVANTARVIPEIKGQLASCESRELHRIYRELDELEDICALINASIVDDPPFTVRDGGMIADGYNADVDQLRAIRDNGKSWIEKIEADEKEATGIKTLKVRYNKVFGYYIEVSQSFLSMVPDHYIRKQTLVNCERYITQDLKDKEATILGAADKLCSLEYELFQQVRTSVAACSTRIQATAALLAELDVYRSLATVAARNKYVCPEVNGGSRIFIKDGRHPVVEQFTRDTYFVPNDVDIDSSADRLMLITGPNMAGKSTYMRQVALITVMAQIGSFVPASDAEIGIVDKVFTRVGASDDLASGQSTFMLEMNEVAYILKNATKKSLIVYDEIGRGTSTFDGMSIARAIAEFTNSSKIGAKTLFATHYHELTSLEDEFDGIVNYNIAAKKRGDNITFLRKIVRGSTDDSYGIEVAKLAGVPGEVVKRAKQILATIESGSNIVTSHAERKVEAEDDSLISIDDTLRAQAIEELKHIDLNMISPYEAMQLLYEIQKKLK